MSPNSLRKSARKATPPKSVEARTPRRDPLQADGQRASPLVTVLEHKYLPSPATASASVERDTEGNLTQRPDAIRGLPLHEACAREWETDAHFTAYAPVTINGLTVRLASDVLDPVELEAIGGAVRMTAMVGDVDDAAAHRDGTPASEEWRADVLPRIEATGLAYYQTKGGYRVLASLPDSFEIRTPADAAMWRETYLGWCAHLEAGHGLVLDRACADWTRLYRLPNVQRDGKPARALLVGTLPLFNIEQHWKDPGNVAAPSERAAAAPLGSLPPADQGLVAALGDWRDHPGRKHGMCYAVGGLLAGLGASREQVAAAVQAWLPGDEPGVDVASGVAEALRGYSEPADKRPGRRMLARLLGSDEHAAIIERAALPRNVAACLERLEARQAEARQAAANTNAAPADPGAAHYHAAHVVHDDLLSMGRLVDRSKPPPPLVYVIEGLDLAQGKVSAVQAFANVAKTPFALLMAVCVASGKPFLGHAVQQRKSLFMAFEGGLLTEEREARMCAGLGLDRASVPLDFMHMDRSLDDQLVAALAVYIREREIGFVVIDTYGSALPGGVDHNSSQFSDWLKVLGRISDATGALIVVLLHENKSDTARGLKRMSGHGSAPGAVQAAIALSRKNDADRTLIDVTCSREVRKAFEPFAIRWLDVPNEQAPTGLALAAERVGATAEAAKSSGSNAARKQEAEEKTRIAGRRIWQELLKGNAYGLSQKGAENVGGEGTRPASRAVARLVDARLVDRTLHGHVTVAEGGKGASASRVEAALAGLKNVAALPSRFLPKG